MSIFNVAGRQVYLDDCDDFYMDQFKWHINRGSSKVTEYVIGRKTVKGRRIQVSLHRLITQCPKNMVVDHINKDGLDNRRANLRVCTATENRWNSDIYNNNKSGFKGVYFDPSIKTKNKWRAQIRVKGKKINLGRYASAEDAHGAYLEAARKHHGSFSPSNPLSLKPTEKKVFI